MHGFGIVNYCFAGLFTVAAGLQLNDPDPTQWIAMYVAAAAACLAWRRHQGAWWLSCAVAGAALVWALALAPDVVGRVGAREFFESMDKKGGNAELAREFGGRMVALTITGLRNKAS